MKIKLLILLVIAALGVTMVALELARRKPAAPPAAASADLPAIQTIETPPPPAPPPPPGTFLDIVRAADPHYPTTQPLVVPVKFAESAKITLDVPLYVDSRGDLWITHPQAAPVTQVIADAGTQQTHVVASDIAYVHWMRDVHGASRPHLIARDADDRYVVISPSGARQRLGRIDYVWSHAMDWRGALVVPTFTGVSVLRLGSNLREQHFDFVAEGLFTNPVAAATTQPADHPIPQIVEDTRGILAFIPWDERHTGSTGVARYLDGQWTILPPEGAADRTIHLIPLLDGSLIRLLRTDSQSVHLSIDTLDALDVPPDQIRLLVDQLSDFQQDKRDAAMESLRRYGQGIWPILEQMADDQPPEARIRIRQILQDRIVPTLAGMSFVEDQVRVVARQPDRTVLLFAPRGVSMRNERDELRVVSPAWIATGPSTGIKLLSSRMTHEMHPDRVMLQWVQGDWIANDPLRGPRVWVGNDFLPLLDPGHRDYRFVHGVDRTGRWLFSRQPLGPGQMPPRGDLLVLDRRLPDPTPRLPVWTWSVPQGQVGWDQQDWPAIRSGSAFALEGEGWRNLDLEIESFFTRLEDARRHPTTKPAGAVSDARVLLTTPDGTQYAGGQDRLIMHAPDGSETIWKLPPNAVGDAPPHLVRTAEGRLFLFNQAGRIIRIAPTPDSAEPFEVEAVFTRQIPNSPQLKRMWLDPAGRIIIMVDDQRVAILFPEGRIPRPIALLMPSNPDSDPW